jgi:hypothetical protein
MTKVKGNIVAVVAALVLGTFVGASTASAKPKTTRAKKPKVTKVKTTPKTPASVRRFSCQGSSGLELTERIVTGTVTSDIVVTDVTVTKTHQFIDGAVVAQPIVDIVSANPTVERSPIRPYDSFQLNRLPAVAANGVGEIVSVYKLNFSKVLPTAPTFKVGLFFDTWKALDGPVPWGIIPSVSVTGAYDMDCTYL